MSEQSTVPGGRGRPAAQRRRLLIWGGVALLLIVLLVVIVASLTRGQDPDGDPTATPAATTSAAATPTPSATEPPATESGAPTPDATPPAEPGAVPEETASPEADIVDATEDDPADFDETSEATPGVRVAVGELSAVEGEPRGAGELAGPALRLVVEITNSGIGTAELDSLVVNLYYGDDARPAPSVSGPNAFNVPAEAAPGATVTGAYVFTVPEDQRDTVRVAVDYSTEVDLVVFEGAAPR